MSGYCCGYGSVMEPHIYYGLVYFKYILNLLGVLGRKFMGCLATN